MITSTTTNYSEKASSRITAFHRKYLIVSAIAHDLSYASPCSNQNVTDLQSYLLEASVDLYSDHLLINKVVAGNRIMCSPVAFLVFLCQYSPFLAAELIFHIDGIISPSLKLRLLKNIYMMSPSSARLVSYIYQLTIARACADSFDVPQYKPCFWHSSQFFARLNRISLLDIHSDELYLSPRTCVSIGHATKVLQALMYSLQNGNKISLITDIPNSANKVIYEILHASFPNRFNIINTVDPALLCQRLLASAYQTDFAFEVLSPMPESIYNKDASRELCDSISKTIHLTFGIESDVACIPIHLRTGNYKPDRSTYETLRNSLPDNYNDVYLLLKRMSFKPTFYTGAKSDVRAGFRYLCALADSDIAEQMLGLLTSNYAILTSSGISHLSSASAACSRIFVNNISFDGDSPKFRNEFFLMKFLQLRSASFQSKLSRVSRSLFMSAYLHNLTLPFITQVFNLYEASPSYIALFVRSIVEKDYREVVSLSELSAVYDFHFELPDYKISRGNYLNLREILDLLCD